MRFPIIILCVFIFFVISFSHLWVFAFLLLVFFHFIISHCIFWLNVRMWTLPTFSIFLLLFIVVELFHPEDENDDCVFSSFLVFRSSFSDWLDLLVECWLLVFIIMRIHTVRFLCRHVTISNYNIIKCYSREMLLHAMNYTFQHNNVQNNIPKQILISN